MAEWYIKEKHPERAWLLWGILAAVIISAPLHFLYEWSGNIAAVGILAPINESIWEHVKLAFTPLLIWWLLGYFIYRHRENISAARWFTACAATLTICSFFIIAFYYTYTGAFAAYSLILNIALLFVSVIIAQLIGRHIYLHIQPGRFCFVTSTVLIVLFLAAFIAFTFSPPHLPLFIDPPSGTYGIYPVK